MWFSDTNPYPRRKSIEELIRERLWDGFVEVQVLLLQKVSGGLREYAPIVEPVIVRFNSGPGIVLRAPKTHLELATDTETYTFLLLNLI